MLAGERKYEFVEKDWKTETGGDKITLFQFGSRSYAGLYVEAIETRVY